jgi:hypothetical protein
MLPGLLVSSLGTPPPYLLYVHEAPEVEPVSCFDAGADGLAAELAAPGAELAVAAELDAVALPVAAEDGAAAADEALVAAADEAPPLEGVLLLLLQPAASRPAARKAAVVAIVRRVVIGFMRDPAPRTK